MKTNGPQDELIHVSNIQPKCRIVVIGLGGAGGNAVSHMASMWTEGPTLIAMNTDAQALAACTAPRVIQIGTKVAQGASAAGDTTVGRLAAEESLDAIQEVLSAADLVFLVVGLGGGTGTGAATVIANAARKLGALTLCFATMPFPFEGERKRRQADEGLRTLQKTADVVICMPNERLLELVPGQTGLEDAFQKSAEIMGEGIHGLWRLLSRSGVMNLDISDIRQLAERSGGSCAYGFSEAEGPARSTVVLQNLMASPLLEKGRLLSEAAGLLINITGGPDLTLSDVQGIMGQITAMARPSVHLFFGAIVDPAYRGKLALTAIASENWLEERRDPRGTSPGVAARTVETTAASKAEELKLNLEPMDKGRFRNVPPTLKGGEDLDIPTFVRRGVRLSFEA